MRQPETRHTFGILLTSNCRSIIVVMSSIYYLHYRLSSSDVRSSGVGQVEVTQNADEILMAGLFVMSRYYSQFRYLSASTPASSMASIFCHVVSPWTSSRMKAWPNAARRVAIYRSSLSNACPPIGNYIRRIESS